MSTEIAVKKGTIFAKAGCLFKIEELFTFIIGKWGQFGVLPKVFIKIRPKIELE
ncbi:hypothetical protein [Paenibacillus macerans]|uniref:hypothetical protein n=1 Tax=Paenibacillus macerans TaxID=44252 RepID=UPI0015590471|nr:hypothetical protein [Paenibacillus macerans]MCY7562865.1 hypothetical protein [Paenibacillus macerans]MEC0155314.1 hypothetical protein [Paenibacillus macerans]